MSEQEPHALSRTNPKGVPFIGKCTKCGREGLSSPFESLPCANPSGETQEQSLIRAIMGEEKQT